MDSSSLQNDGVTLTSEASVRFLEFLHIQVVDLIGYFENRDGSMVSLDGTAGQAQRQVESTPRGPDLSSFNFPEGYLTPVVPAEIRSGVIDE